MISLNIDTFVAEIYSSLRSIPPLPPEHFLNRMIFAPWNNDINNMNSKLLNMMLGEEQVFYGTNTMVWEVGADIKTLDVNTFPTEFLYSLTAPSLPQANRDLNPIDHLSSCEICPSPPPEDSTTTSN